MKIFTKNYSKILAVLICLMVAGQPFQSVLADSATSTAEIAQQQSLNTQIAKKNQDLQAIKDQIASTQAQLQTTQSQKQNLQGEVSQINTSIKQLDLGIKLSQTSVQKLGLQIQSTQLDIVDSETQIKDKTAAVISALQELQQKGDNTNIMMIFLSNNNLANTVSEVQNLTDFQNNLIKNIQELRGLKNQLSVKLQTAAEQKKAKEIENENLSNRKIIVQQTQAEKQTLLTQTKNQEKIYQQSLTALQQQQQQIEDEIYAVEQNLLLKLDRSLLPKSRPGVLGLPVDLSQTGIAVTQKFGHTTFSAKGAYSGKPHNGLDLGMPVGTTIYAAEKGKVVGAANQDLYCRRGAYGKFVAIEHENNLSTVYGHLSLWVVKEGQTVNKGDIIGYSGRTGFATGPHLHFGVYASQSFYIGSSKTCGPEMPYGAALNPADYLNLSGLAVQK